MANVTYMGYNKDTYKSMVVLYKYQKVGKLNKLVAFGKKICYSQQDETDVVDNCELKKGFYKEVEAYEVVQKEDIQLTRRKLGL